MSGSPPPGGVAEISTVALPGLRAVIIQVVVPGAPTRTEAEGVYSPLLTLMAFFFPDLDADHWYPVVRLVWSVNSIFSHGIKRT